ncbi:hypothetical protein FHR99_003226 [Litorivivens lipolytica]|uniref:Uncharacterized protein n=1 Tax=Litorivivens lipolytica TaxID=1524264 RepID=A0A7W4W7N4_9GAMM|nr:hypothetical protein [Litorivivens lipolytica]MBB3048952.1 hypothetical protein [Litorivivens lipolytica]
MSMGYRVFIVEADGSIKRLPNAAWERFFLRGEPELKSHAGRDVLFAMAYYTREGRQPQKIIRIDASRCTANTDGSINETRAHDAMRAALSRLSESTQYPDPTATSNQVVNAQDKFEARRDEYFHPDLSIKVKNRIIEAIFR